MAQSRRLVARKCSWSLRSAAALLAMLVTRGLLAASPPVRNQDPSEEAANSATVMLEGYLPAQTEAAPPADGEPGAAAASSPGDSPSPPDSLSAAATPDDPKKEQPISWGAGVILAYKGGKLLIWTAAHILHPRGEATPLEMRARLRDRAKSAWLPASVEKEDTLRDIAILSVDPPGDWQPWRRLSCHANADVPVLSHQTELVAVGGPNWMWSRLNRFNRADDDAVYMETPTDRGGFSGGPVFLRGSLDFVGIYTQGSEGIVKVRRLDTLRAQQETPETKGDLDKQWPQPSCGYVHTEDADSVLRLGLGYAQLQNAGAQHLSPLLTGDFGATATLVRFSPLSLAIPFNLQFSAAYFDPGAGNRVLFAEAFANVGLRVASKAGFIDALWAPGIYSIGRDQHWTARTFRLNLGRRFGEDTAGLSLGYLQRVAAPSIFSVSLFTEFELPADGGDRLEGLPDETTPNSPRTDAMVHAERDRTEAQNVISGPGLVVMSASDQRFGQGGFVGGYRTDLLRSRVAGGGDASIVFVENLEIVVGTARLVNDRRFFASAAGTVGPRIRLGAPNGLILAGYYYAPVYEMEGKTPRFPLVGVGGDVGWQVDRWNFGLQYRYQLTSELYRARPNITLVGLNVNIGAM